MNSDAHGFISKVGMELLQPFFVYVDDGQPIGPAETLCWGDFIRWGST